MKKKKHKHKFRVLSYSMDGVEFWCAACKERRRRELSKKEQKFMAKHTEKVWGNVHDVWYKFMDEFTTGGATFPTKWNGKHLFDKVRKWAEKYPEHIRVVSCDDGTNAGSLLVLIEHKAEKQYMGTTMLFVPQCTGESPTEIFLYPGHNIELQKALRNVRSQAKAVEKTEREERKKDSRELNAAIQWKGD